MSKKSILLPVLFATIATLGGCTGRSSNEDKYTKDGKLKVKFRNLYFDDYNGGDTYLEEIEKRFGLSIELESYSWNDWSTQVNGQVLSDTVTDVFHANIDSYNFASYYKFWAEEEVAKQLPDDLSKWPNIKDMIEHTSNIESLKLNGHLYGIPIAKNTKDYSTSFSPFTYIYRRDWAKKYGVYQENDEYTWKQFETLLETFAREFKGTDVFALGDVEWGFPSITNFYKQVPHCFAQDEATGKYVNNYTTDAYVQGLEMSKRFRTNNWYGYPQYTAVDGELNRKYYGNLCGVLYENLSYDNFTTLKEQLIKSNVSVKDFNVDDATAIMKIKAPTADDFDTPEDKAKYASPYGGKYCLEGTDNWFSMTFFDYKMSDNKLNKILDLLDWLLSEEGTTFAIYGFEDYDYVKDSNGNIQIVEEYWPKEENGEYAPKRNGAKYLRKMASLGYDTQTYDPLTDKEAVEYLNNWNQEMKAALERDELKILKENSEVMWLTSPMKAEFSGLLRTEALASVTNYIYGDIKTVEKFKESVTNGTWTKVLNEINETLGK